MRKKTKFSGGKETKMIEFVKKYKTSIFLSVLFSLLCFGFMLTHFTITIDEESWILSARDETMWLYQGRFIIWLFDLIFTEGGNYAPFLWDISGILFWNLSGIIFAYCLFAKTEIKQWILFIFLSYYSSLTFVLGDVFSFSMYSLQIGLASVTVAAAFYYTLKYLEKKNWKTALIVLGLLLYSFGTYQAFICVYISTVAAFCLLCFLSGHRDRIKYDIIISAVLCLIAIASYYLINFIIGKAVGTQGYLTENYIGWTSGEPLKAFALAMANVGRVSFAIPVLDVYVNGGTALRWVTIAFVIYAIWKFFKCNGIREKAGIFFFSVALCFAPFSLYLAIATYKTQGRMMLALPLVGAVQLYLILREINKKALLYAAMAASGYLLFINARDMNLFYYYSSIVYEKDCSIAEEIMYDIEEKGIDYREKPLAFIGMVAQEPQPTKELGVLGGSMFAWDEGNNLRMTDFIQTRGYNVRAADSTQLQKALVESASMTVWPQEGSIKELDDVIVVYLSQPVEEWYITNQAQ